MATSKPEEGGFNYAYITARGIRHKAGENAPRKERLVCAVVELGDRIKEVFPKVAKDWQVSVEELRRQYSEVYPAPRSGEPCTFNLEHACEGVMRDLRANIQTYAVQFWVPDDLLEAMLVDWLVADQMGQERTPPKFFVPETEAGAESTPAPQSPPAPQSARGG